MDLNTNGARTIAALVVLNAGLLISHHSLAVNAHRPVVFAKTVNSGQLCKATMQAHEAALVARYQARQAAREVTRQAVRAAMIAPTNQAARSHSSVTSYVKCMANSGTRSINGGS